MTENGCLSLVPPIDGAAERVPAPNHGSIIGTLNTIQRHHGFDIFNMLRNYDIDGDIVEAMERKTINAQYQVVDGDSVATDRDVYVPNDLFVQAMEVRGLEVVKMHRNLLTFFRRSFENVSAERRLELLAAWEIGRFVGHIMHDELRMRQRRLPMLGFRALEFSKLVYEEVTGDDFTAEEVSFEAQRQHYLHALPERVASSVGMAVLVDSGMAEEQAVLGLVKKMREHALQPIYNAMEFRVGQRENQEVITLGKGDMPDQVLSDSDVSLSISELGAIFPLDNSGLKAYCQYLKDTEKVSFLPNPEQ